MTIPRWLARHDPGLSALRRAARTAIVMPALFALGTQVIGNSSVATFAAFGSFAMLLLVDFSGPMPDRLRAQAALAGTGAAFVCLGTLASHTAWLAALAMAVVGLVVLFAGVVSSVLAGASTSLLLAFILPVSLPAPASQIPDRLAGWALASVAAFAAVALLWPAPARDPLRGPAAAACRALAARLRSRSAVTDNDAVAVVAALHRGFLATPYRPTGLTTSARLLVRLVDELTWLTAVLGQTRQRAGYPTDGVVGPGERAAAAVTVQAAAVLDRGAEVLDRPDLATDGLRSALLGLESAREAMERSATTDLPVTRSPTDTGHLVSSLEPTFRAQELSYAVTLIGRNIDLATTAGHRNWRDRLLGRQPAGLTSPLSTARQRATAHLEWHSVWLHNSVRGAVGLGLAVLVADLTGVQHSFWVVLGTLSVLRSNTLNTGQNAVRAVLGTVVGFIVGAGLLAAIGTNTTLLWFLLPVAILVAGVAPAAISFAAGQAAFTLTLVILFNIIQPAGWRVGLLRVEDIALGCTVSVVVALLFWPRGAGAALGRALAEAYTDSARYLARAVEFGMLRCDRGGPGSPPPMQDAERAAGAARRLDDAFRSYLAERGAKPVPLAEVTSLVTGVAGLRLAAEAVLDLWQRQGDGTPGDRAAARAELTRTSELVRSWYSDLAISLTSRQRIRGPLAHDGLADSRLLDAVRHDLRGDDGRATATAVRMIWTGDHLDAARRLQAVVAGPARTATARAGLTPLRGRHRLAAPDS
jgi:uncharacterized membrane protein YccC